MTENSTPLEHQNVPVAHQELHSFLYSSDDEHNVNPSSIELDFDGTEILEISQWFSSIGTNKIAGVYAILDGDRGGLPSHCIYQFVGYSRDVLRSVKGHIAQNGTEACTFIKLKTFKFPKRQAMEALKQEWLAQLDYMPAGNTAGSTWASTIREAARATMTNAEKNAYEDKKLKLRKAMADASLVDELSAKDNQTEAQVQRRQKLEEAVKNDDWSSVIDAQN